jgi:hypothetical protein
LPQKAQKTQQMTQMKNTFFVQIPLLAAGKWEGYNTGLRGVAQLG